MTAIGRVARHQPAPAGAATCPPPPLDLEHHIRFSNSGGPSDVCLTDFIQGTYVLYCDTDGVDGRLHRLVRRDTGDWFDSDTETVYHYGRPGDFPICGDWDGNGTDGIGVVRGNTWFLRNAASGGDGQREFGYGRADDFPLVGDWNGDGSDTPGVVRGNIWFLRNFNSGGAANLSFGYGRPDDFPLVGDFNGDGSDTPGVVRGNIWFLRNFNSGGDANLSFGYGRADDFPISADAIAQGLDTPIVVRFVGSRYRGAGWQPARRVGAGAGKRQRRAPRARPTVGGPGAAPPASVRATGRDPSGPNRPASPDGGRRTRPPEHRWGRCTAPACSRPIRPRAACSWSRRRRTCTR